MEQDKAFERKYSINVVRLKPGKHTEAFSIDRAFFEQMPHSLISEGEVQVRLEMVKYSTHIDAKFFIEGKVQVACDRCGDPYLQPISDERRIVYSFSESMKFDGHEVIYVDSEESSLSLVQELYDFVHLALPMRKVPEPSTHLCEPEVLALLGLDEHGEPLPEDSANAEDSDEPVDERWAALKKLRDQMED
jgi:uncharacterized metal-binding protein YceD (DUF177 family)